MTVHLFVDQDVEAAYIELSDHPVARTVEFGPNICVDLDNLNVVVGIEVIGFGTTVPYDELARRFHIHSDVIAEVNRLRPSIGYAVRMMVTGDSVTGLSRRDNLVAS